MFDTPDTPRARFIEDELMRVPMVADQVIGATWRALQQALPSMPPPMRSAAADLLAAERTLHTRFIEPFAAAVRRMVREREAPAGTAAPVPPARERTPPLALLDDSAVVADVGISRALEAVRSIAEHELRELTAFTAALAGDMDVARDHNPLQPEVFARALWEAVQALPVGQPQQLTLMQHAGTPLAQVLRKVYAGACARLESAGLTPAAYRTLVPQPGARGWRPDDSLAGHAVAELHRRQQAPAADSAAADARPSAAPARGAAGTAPAGAPAAELLSRLFEAILADRRVSRDIRGVLAQVHAVAQRAAQDDPATLERDDHPLWRFVDELVFQASLFAKGSTARDDQLGLSESLVASLARAGAGDGAAADRARARLAEEARRRFEARVAAMAQDIDVLQALEEDEAASASDMPTGFGPLDASQLDTVPAALMDSVATDGARQVSADPWIDALIPGDWVQLFTQGQWLQAQLVWRGRRGEVWLFGQGQTMRSTALRRRAIERLAAEGLLRPLVRRSILRSAAARLLRDGGQDAG